MAEPNNKQKGLVLASGSRIRRSLLQSAGVSFTVAPADLDERAIRDSLGNAPGCAGPDDVAAALASAKAKSISKEHPDALVIGCDQTLFFENKLFEKPKDLEAARANLIAFRGKTHQLYSAVALVDGGAIVWSRVARADLTVRDFSDDFIEEYLARLGNAALESLGGYHLEALGIQLFDRIDGDYFTVLGLPLLPLIKELRQRKVLCA
ncbi:MAG: Maf family nucleotide pyrophosphatase [Alphaproteobacteria bacterium]|nr:Maf family nucleotide pyrophosphatase [Alphaproteobacteria bacterium]